jgi:hypothetical protein
VKALASVRTWWDAFGCAPTRPRGRLLRRVPNAEPVARNLERVISWLEVGTLARARLPRGYRDFATAHGRDRERYQRFGLELTGPAMDEMLGYLARKPKGVFGAHEYDPGPSGAVATERARFRPYQDYFGIPDEI